MKIAILAAGASNGFPLLIARPKCLYYFGGEVQLERVIKVAQKFVSDKDIIVVAGYKHNQIKKYIKKKHPQIDCRVNIGYSKAAVLSLRKAIEGINDDVVFMMADENISEENVEKICKSNKKMAIMCHDIYYYYSLGILKLRKDVLHIINDDEYLSLDYIKEVYCFAHNKSTCDEILKIESGVCLGYTIIDFIRRIGNIRKVEDPMKFYHGNDIDFIHYNPEVEYIPDIDHFYDTDEYKEKIGLKLYSDYISDPIRVVGRFIKKILRKIHIISVF